MGHVLAHAPLQGDHTRDREAAMGTQGTPVDVGGLIRQKLYPELWEARDTLVQLSNDDA